MTAAFGNFAERLQPPDAGVGAGVVVVATVSGFAA
jgi:hypothetical protein